MSYDIDSVTDRREASQSVSQFSTASPENSSYSLPDPFSPSMNHVFFSGADRRILLDEVIHLCQFGNNLVAAIGDDGVGKTAFLNQARFELSETAFCCLINSDDSMTPEHVFSQIIVQLELPVSSASSAGEMIATLRHAMAEENMHRVVVIIDDAHRLSDGILSALISLLQGHQGQHLHILMGGEKTLVERLDHFDMVDVLVYDVTLNPFTQHDTKEYLDFKLTTAGYPREKLLDAIQVESIWKESGGYPAQISKIAGKYIFQQGSDIGEDVPSVSGIPLVHMALLVILLAALILALIYIGGDADEASIENQEQIEQPIIQNPIKEDLNPQQSLENGPLNSTITAPNKPDVPAVNMGQSAQNIGLAKEELKIQKPILSPAESSASGQASTKAPSSDNKSDTVSADGAKPDGSAISSPSLSQGSSPALQESLKQELKKEAELLSVDELKSKMAGDTLPVSTKKSKDSASSKPPSFSNDENWLLSLNDSEYVLQVIAAGQKQSVQKFIELQPNKAKLRLIEVGRDGKPWYIVVSGSYKDNDSARRAIQSLPQDQVNGGPWPRNVADLKREINAFRTK